MDNTQVSVQQMEIAARNIDKSIGSDAAAPTLLSMMSAGAQMPGARATASGLSDYDYPTLAGMPDTFQTMLSQVKLHRQIPHPPQILQIFAHNVQGNFAMGLFPEINRAWMTVDCDIYVWTYEENDNFLHFNGFNDAILCIGLIQPKPDVFLNDIKYLLVVVTAVEIIILGLTFVAGINGIQSEIQLIPDPIFTLPTDGAIFTTIVGTKMGRLFMGSRDGYLYEIAYQAEGSWFGKRCRKVNWSTSVLSFLVPSFINAALSDNDPVVQITVDDSRHILYVLTEKGNIEVCDLGQNGDDFYRVMKMTQFTIVSQAVNIVKTLDSSNFRPIVSISAVEKSESPHIHLVAITQTGVRLYFTTQSLQSISVTESQRPYTLVLVHIRLPPGYSAHTALRPKDVQKGCYSDRTLILSTTAEDKGSVWCISGDLFPFSQTLMEAYTSVKLDAPALTFAEVKQRNELADIGLEGLSTVARQHCELQRKYVFLTSQGVLIVLKQRPVDILKDILLRINAIESIPIKTFFVLQKEEQACATALIIATLETEENNELAELATRTFFFYGGEPRLSSPTLGQSNMFSGTTQFSPNIVSTPASHHLQSPRHVTFTQQPLHVDASSPFVLSAKHNGLYLYLGRILRPIWDRKCIEIPKEYKKQENKVFLSTITCEHCRCLLKYLLALHEFLRSNTQLSINDQTNQANLSTTMNVTRVNHTIQDAQIEERISLQALKFFVSFCCQVIGLWRILCENDFSNLIGSLSANQQQILQTTTFKEMLLYGQDICSVLIGALVERYLNEDTSIDSISTKLRETCPDLYRIEDAAFTKANELLKTCRSVLNPDEKTELVQSALNLCKSIVPNINLPEICKQFTALKAYSAVLDLCITCAQKMDPRKIAEHYYRNDEKVEDQEGRNFYYKRMAIYQEIFKMLDGLYSLSDEPETTRPQVFEIIDEILRQDDEILHAACYDWMLAKNMTGELIKLRIPTLENYLLHISQTQADNVLVLDVLWKYYENNEDHANAAKILDTLANKPGTGLTLAQRIEYLTRAIMCMRTEKVGYAPYLGVFLKDLEDKLDVARAQEKMLQAVMAMQGYHPAVEDAMKTLNAGLYDMSQLYENFAEPLNLWECKLAIIDIAGYNDENIVKNIWKNIILKEVQISLATGTERMVQILNKVKVVAREHGLNSRCFPLYYLVSELERLAIGSKVDDVSLVPNAFIQMGVPYGTLLEIYNKMMCAMCETPFWREQNNEDQLYRSVMALMRSFIENHKQVPESEKKKFVVHCEDAITTILSSLYARVNVDHLIVELKGIETQLSRISDYENDYY